MRYCKCGCGVAIPEHEGRGRRREYASAACRKRGERSRNRTLPPGLMLDADRWMRWRMVRRGDGHTKLPLTVSGAPASSTDADTWCSYAEASSSDMGDGLGFALGDGFACIDLDHCMDASRRLLPWAKMILAPVEGKTYVEVSPSGDGLHIWGTCEERKGVRARDLMNAEAYSQGRYMTVTMKPYGNAVDRLADITFLYDVIERLATP